MFKQYLSSKIPKRVLHKRVLCFQWVLLWTFSPCQATTFAPQPFTQIVKQAPIIVRGVIGMHYADWGQDSEGTKRIYTFYELQLGEVFKGTFSRNSIMIREMGGEKEDVGMTIQGASQYERGEDVIVFLRNPNSDGTYDVQGLMMGKYNLNTDSSGIEYLVGPGIMEGHNANGHGNRPSPWTLEKLRHLIHTQKKSLESSHEKLESIASPTPTFSTSPTSQNLESAPQLHSEETQSSNPSFFSNHWIAGIKIVGLVGLIGFSVLLWRKNRNRV